MRFLWRIPDDYPETLIGEYQKEIAPDRFDLQKGKFLGCDWGVPAFEFQATCKELRKFDDLANNAMVPLVSNRIAKFLNQSLVELVELIPASIKTQDGNLDGYSVVNVLHLGESVDRQKSQYTCIPGTEQPMSFSKLEFLGNPDSKMIIREKIYPGFIVVTDAFKQVCDEQNWNGVGLFQAEDV